jgi:hypothetical protein
MYAGQVPLIQARPILPTRSGSSRIMNRPKWSGCLGFTPTSATWFLNSRKCEPGVMIGDEMPSTWNRSRSSPLPLRSLMMSA